MQTLETVGYERMEGLAAAPSAHVTAWLSDPQMPDSTLIQKLKDMQLPLAGRSQLVLMCTAAGRVDVVRFLETNGAWNPYMHGDQWRERIVAAVESRHKPMIEYTAKQYAGAAQAPFCVPIDKRALLAGILTSQSPSVAKMAIEAFGLQKTALLSGDVAVYDIKSELGQLVWHHQKSLHLTVTDNRSVAAFADCCGHSAPVDNGQAFKGQFSNILIGHHGYRPADGKPRRWRPNNFDGPYVLLGFVDESRKSPVEFYLIGTGTFSEYARTEIKDKGHVLDAFSLMQVGASSCHALVTRAAAADPPDALRVDYQSNGGCVHLMLEKYALVAVHTIKNAEHAMATAAGHGFGDKLKELFGSKKEDGEEGKPTDKKEGAKTQGRHGSSAILLRLKREFPPRAVVD